MIFVTAREKDWEQAKAIGYYTSPSLAQEGFIHCATESQLVAVMNKHFKGATDVLILTVDPKKVKAPVKFENLKGKPELFPHVYGTIEVSAVVNVCPLKPGADGLFSLPSKKKCGGPKQC